MFCHLKIRYFKASIHKMGLTEGAWNSSYGKGVNPKFPSLGWPCRSVRGMKRGLCLLRVKYPRVFNPWLVPDNISACWSSGSSPVPSQEAGKGLLCSNLLYKASFTPPVPVPALWETVSDWLQAVPDLITSVIPAHHLFPKPKSCLITNPIAQPPGLARAQVAVPV